jgi:hypothetical protein
MSLDVSLYSKTKVKKTCHHCDSEYEVHEELFSSNITHNLGRMAKVAGIYEALWRPEEINITEAKQLLQPLKEGLNLMKADPDRFKAFDSPNGWGTYEHFLPWVQEYFNACVEFPDAEVSASR